MYILLSYSKKNNHVSKTTNIVKIDIFRFSLRTNKYNNQSLESPSFFSPPGTLNNRCFVILGYQLGWFQNITFHPLPKMAEKWGTTRMSPPFHAPKNQTNADQVALQPWLRWPNSPRLRKDIPWWFETELGNADVWGSFFKTRGGNPGGFLKGKSDGCDVLGDKNIP